MAICTPNFSFLALTVSDIEPLKFLFSEISNLKYGVGFELGGPALGVSDGDP